LENFHAVVGAASDSEDLASQVSTETQNGTRSSYFVTDCLLGKEFFEEDFTLRGIDPRRISFEKGRPRLHLTQFKSTNGDIRPNGIGIEKCIESGCRCNEVDIRQQEDGHVFDDKLQHGADAEKAEFFDSRCTRPQAIWSDYGLSGETWSGIVRPLISKSRSMHAPMKSGCAPGADLQKVKGVIEWLFDIDAKK
jgi:hypothetical protein